MSFTDPQIVSMNETEVRENIVRQLLLNPLSYTFDGIARVRAEIPLRYGKAFLGRKKANDSDLRGRADYVCEVVSYGRWVIEVKAGHEALTEEDAQQAHTYAAHPEVAAFYYLVTNGREFRLYAGQPHTPIITWRFDEMISRWATIENILGPDAIRRKAKTYEVDIGKPLALGLGSTGRIVGGFLTYDEHSSSDPMVGQELAKMQGMRGTFTGRDIWRTEDGMIKARIEIRGPYKEWDELNRAAGINGYEFESAVEFVSNDPAKPTIFQGITIGAVRAGQEVRVPGQPIRATPLGMKMVAAVEATGYFAESKFQGTFRILYLYELAHDGPIDFSLFPELERTQLEAALKVLSRPQVEAFLLKEAARRFSAQSVESLGTFEMNIQ